MMSDVFFQKLFWLAYRIKLIYNWFFHPETYGVYIAVWVNGKILLIKNSYKSYHTIPCGGLHKHETSKQGAIRELLEEVNIKASVDDLLFITTLLSLVENMKDHITFYEINLSEVPEFQVDNREVTWAKFEEPEMALKRELFPAVREYLRKKVE